MKTLVALVAVLLVAAVPLQGAALAIESVSGLFDSIGFELVVFGALTLEGINLVRERTRMESRKPGSHIALKAFFKVMNDVYKNADLKIKFISALETADVVISDAACKLYVLFGVKPSASTTNAWYKVSDHASAAAAAPDIVAKFVGTGGGSQEQCILFPNGLQLATGATAGCHEAAATNVKSAAADAVTGFAIVGAA